MSKFFLERPQLNCLLRLQRARVWVQHDEDLDYPISGPEGNPKVTGFTNYGCPVFSAGNALVTETILIEASPSVLAWMQEVALTPGYKNPYIEVTAADCTYDGPAWETTEEDGPTEAESDKAIKEKEDDAAGDKNATNIKLALVDMAVKPATAAGETAGRSSADQPKKSVSFAEGSKPALDEAAKPTSTNEPLPVVTKPEPVKPVPESEQVALELEKQQMKAALDGFSEAVGGNGGRILNAGPRGGGHEKSDSQGGAAADTAEERAKAMVLRFLAQSEDAAIRALELGEVEDDE